MSASPTPGCESGRPASGSLVLAACGGQIFYSSNTPGAIFNGEPVYFCLSACKADFERDPHVSCLAGRLFSPAKE